MAGMPHGFIEWGLLKWDGIGFKVPVPMAVIQWRGLRHKPRGK
jgi:hypothetical protein